MREKEFKEIIDLLKVRVDQKAPSKLDLSPKAKGPAVFDQLRNKLTAGLEDVIHIMETELGEILNERGVSLSENEAQDFLLRLRPTVLEITKKYCTF